MLESGISRVKDWATTLAQGAIVEFGQRFQKIPSYDLKHSMKIKYTLETLKEFKNAASNVRQKDDSLPAFTGTLEARVYDGTFVELIGDSNFEFLMPFKEFVIQICELADIKLMARDNIPE